MHHCCDQDTEVEDVVGAPEDVKLLWEESLWEPDSIDRSSSDVQSASEHP